jgi:putative transposase-like DNA-binding protein
MAELTATATSAAAAVTSTATVIATATATATAHRAVMESTGEIVSGRVLVRRVSWMLDLIQTMADAVLTQGWTPTCLEELASGKSGDGRPLPAKGWMAIRRLGRSCQPPHGIYVSDRLRRCAEEQAARALRLALYRRSITSAIIQTWPVDSSRRTEPEWQALRAALPAGVGAAEIRNRTRQIRTHLTEHGTLPQGLPDLEAPPTVSRQALLAAADKQLFTMRRVEEDAAVLRLQLPLTAAPATRRDWAWHVIVVRLPPTIPAEVVKLCAPTLRVTGHRVRVDLPFRVRLPCTSSTGHSTAAGFDWGLNTLLTGALGHLTADGRVLCDGRMLRYDATAISAKLHRLRGHREDLAAKRAHYATLLDELASPHPRWAELHRLRAHVEAEHAHVCARIRYLNDALAWSAARWVVDTAQQGGASVIYLEDLTTLEARGHRRGNARLSGQVRGTVVHAIRHLAAKAGIAVITVPARGTSKYCPRCGTGASPLTHTPAPDRSGERGWKWSICSRCGLSCDRDFAAAERIVSRGLLGQHHVRTDRTSGVRTTMVAIEGNVARARRARRTTKQTVVRPPLQRARTSRAKTGPTAKRRTRTRTRTRQASRVGRVGASSRFSRQAPDRRLVPSPTPVSGCGQRPEGQPPQTHRRKIVETGAARDPQSPPTGFHYVRATPVLPLHAAFGVGAGLRSSGMPESLRKTQRITDAAVTAATTGEEGP